MSTLIWKDYSVIYTAQINTLLLETGGFIIVSDVHSFLSVDQNYIRCIILDCPNFSINDFIFLRRKVKQGIDIIVIDQDWNKELHNFLKNQRYQLKKREAAFNEFNSSSFCCEEMIQINKMNRSVIIQGNIEVEMTKKEFNLFYFLFENKGQIINTEEIIKRVWSGLTSEANVYMTIQKIRNKVEINPKSPELLVTKKGGGYIFNYPNQI
ncbi:winged helix-turn-helix domain-containing protein [Paenibacillus sp. FSL K6-1122]|uniref:Winged helix-turn-helix domain-containing protein n=1 Tax=Paenibacillus amylolyticus TaxID=1451 RepID=A0ABD8AVE6_PAEAM|nr:MULTISPECIES: winged helix-turn-helix domain-containing protein [Paenibacillus]ETT40267.1 winged helix family transcriptional regulator [Paenibacillus sp. FSL R5-192]ETT46839.1 winged helix family transcriptional regulator [Paenibacillus sp. FSL H7-689]OME91769.1 hypothetical protein BK124_27835 [Paenibacillus amylolyticus]